MSTQKVAPPTKGINLTLRASLSKNLCLTCPHYNGKQCIKLPYEYCRITHST